MIEYDPSRTTDEQSTEYVVDDGISEVQRGLFKRPEFFGDHSISTEFKQFSEAADLASGVLRHISSIVPTSTQSGYKLTTVQYTQLTKIAQSISTYGNIPNDTTISFLLILCYIDQIQDMKVIADAVQITELYDESILRKPDLILSIRNLHRVAFCASAVDGLVDIFRKYISMSGVTESAGTNDLKSVLDVVSSVIGGFSGFESATPRLEIGTSTEALGHFMSELVTGNRIPMSVIAKNPNLQSPSYIGKTMFGEGPTSLSNIDMNQLLNKRIGCFPKFESGAGTTSFGIQNLSSVSKLNTPITVVAKIALGSFPDAYTKKARQLDAMMEKVRTLTGCVDNEVFNLNSADVAIPMMSAISAICSDTDKPIFTNDVFSQAWLLSNSVTNQLQHTNPNLLQMMNVVL